jgi:hypothetical protein
LPDLRFGQPTLQPFRARGAAGGPAFPGFVVPAAAMAAVLLLMLAACGSTPPPDAEKAAQTAAPAADPAQLLPPEQNVATPARGARAIASSFAASFPISNLNDGTGSAWGAAEGPSDVYAAIVLPAGQAIQEFRLQLFSPNEPPRPHLRDIRVVAADAEPSSKPPDWRVVKCRLAKSRPFTEKVSVPPLADGTVVSLELDRTDPNWGPHKVWGFGCFSESRGDLRNYLTAGTGVYVREIQMK